MQAIDNDLNGYKTVCVRRVRTISQLDATESRFEFSLLLRPKRMDGSDAGRMSSCAVENGFLGTRFVIGGLDDIQVLGFGLHYIDHTLFMLQGACEVWVDELPFFVEQRSAFFLKATKPLAPLEQQTKK